MSYAVKVSKLLQDPIKWLQFLAYERNLKRTKTCIFLFITVNCCLCREQRNYTLTMAVFRWFVAGFSPRRPCFDPTSGHCPSSGILNNRSVRKMDLFPSSNEGMIGAVSFLLPNKVDVSHPLMQGRKQIQFPKCCIFLNTRRRTKSKTQ
jgi:hypothetical protein